MSIIIRNATVDDVSSILDIYKPYIENTVVTFEYDAPSLSEFTDRFNTITKNDAWIVCEIDNQIAGYAYAAPPFERAAFKWDTEFSIYINSAYHSRHIGTALYNCLLDIATKQGYYNIYSLIESKNKTSLKMHEKLGFKEITTMKNIGYKHKKWCDLTWLLLQIHEYDATPQPPKKFKELDKTQIQKIYQTHSSQII